jgi:hypothetical protein
VARWMCCCGYRTRVDVAASSQKEAAVLDPAAVRFAPILGSFLLLHNPIFNLLLRQLQGPEPSTGRVRSSGTTAAMRHVRGLVASLRGQVLSPEDSSGHCNITLCICGSAIFKPISERQCRQILHVNAYSKDPLGHVAQAASHTRTHALGMIQL